MLRTDTGKSISLNWYRSATHATGALLLVSSLSLHAGEIDNIYLEIDQIRDRLSDRLNLQVEQRVQSEVRARVRQSVEASVNEAVFETVSEAVSATLDAPLPGRTDDVDVQQREKQSLAKIKPLLGTDRLISNQLNRIENEIERVLNTVHDGDGNTALANEWLIMTDQDSLDQLVASGFIIKHIEELSGLGYLLGTVSAPLSFNPEEAAAVQVLDDPQIIVDLNHVYLPQREETGSANFSNSMITPANRPWNRIGMIDSGINQAHPVFRSSTILEKNFATGSAATQHGTAIASILVGNAEGFQGRSATSELYNGVVFAKDKLGREYSTTAAIVRAINWLAENNVRLINMSLAGPDNAILRQAVSSACNKGIVLVTAAGNAGPAAGPLYPAAYDCTIAVTAVDQHGLPYHRANRGDHIDYALRGVDVRHAAPDGDYSASSGTSFAAAALSGLIAANVPEDVAGFADVKSHLNTVAADLGMEGRDRIFGQGLIRPTLSARISD